MAWEKCENCEKEFFKKAGVDSCPHCNQVIESRGDYLTTLNKEQKEALKESLARQAGDQARVVGKFGEVLQVVGYVFIAIFSIALIVSLFTKNWIGLIVFLIAIPATFVSYNVFGSALRAIALYIQVKVKG